MARQTTQEIFESRLYMKIQFKPWLVEQVSSGKYKGLEWIDSEEKRIFKVPWTKKNYPDWEEHHKIFQVNTRFSFFFLSQGL